MKYVSQGPLLVDVHMHKPLTNSRNFMDSLLAFWPGLQVKMMFFLSNEMMFICSHILYEAVPGSGTYSRTCRIRSTYLLLCSDKKI